MQEYRANIMGLDGHIELRMVLMCKDETEAKKRARCLADGYDVELWFEDRKIAEFKSEKTSLSWQPARHPATARERPSIAEILGKLEARRIAVFLCGLRTQSKFGDEYKNAFAAMFSGLASEQNVLFYPAFDDAFVDMLSSRRWTVCTPTRLETKQSSRACCQQSRP